MSNFDTWDPVGREAELRAHLDHIIKDYALKNICINHEPYLEWKFKEIFRQSKPIPTSDKTQITLPEDPWDAFKRLTKFEEMERFDEKWMINKEVATRLRTHLAAPFAREQRTTRIWHEEDSVFKDLELKRPMLPILTKRAIKATPKLGSGRHEAKSRMESWADTSVPAKLKNLEVPSGFEEEAPVDRDKLFGTRLELDAETKMGIKNLVSHCPLLIRSPPGGFKPTAVKTFLQARSPPYVQEFKPMSPPIFRRSDVDPANFAKSRRPRLTSFEDLTDILPKDPVPMEEEEPMHMANARIVDGWNVLAEAWPSTSSRETTPDLIPGTSSLPSEDWKHLIPLSSPVKREPPIEKMEEIIFPRKPHNYKEPIRISSYADIIERGLLKPVASHPGSAGEAVAVRSPSPSASLIGQPPTITVDENDLIEEYEVTDDYDKTIQKFVERNIDSKSVDELLDLKLNERDSLLMNVPKLPEPPFAKRRGYPNMESMVISSEETVTREEGVARPFLKKLRGLISLNLELSWRPFDYGDHVPTANEIIGVGSFFKDDGEQRVIEDRLSKLQVADNIPTGTARHLASLSIFGDLDLPSLAHRSFPSEFNIILTRAERAEAAKLARGGNNSNLVERQSTKRDSYPELAAPPLSKRMRQNNYAEAESQQTSFDPLSISSQLDILPLTPPDNISACPNLVMSNSKGLDEQNQSVDYDYWLSNDAYQNADIPARLTPPDLDFSQRLTDNNEPVYDEPLFLPSSGSLASYTLSTTNEMTNPITNSCQTPSTHHMRTAVIEYASAGNNLAHFMQIRGHAPSVHSQNESVEAFLEPSLDPIPANTPVQEKELSSHLRPTPEEVLKCGELQLPDRLANGVHSQHRYIVSFSLIQKHILTNLIEREYQADLVERASLDLPDILLDPHSSIILCHLASLPQISGNLANQLCTLSWSYRNITIIFEAYSEWRSYRSSLGHNADATGSMEPYPFPPHIIKSIRTLRRTMVINEASEKKDLKCHISFAFPRSVAETAELVRALGDAAEQRSRQEDKNNGDLIWDNRSWIGVDEWEGEEDLAAIYSMNLFAAIVILSRVDIDPFLDASSEDRSRVFAQLLGRDRMMNVNKVIDERKRMIQQSSEPYYSE